MSAERSGGLPAPHQDGADVKQCCARLYESEIVSRLLGDWFHPGGATLTEHLGALLGLTAERRVLDVASGRGASAVLLARCFGCDVIGVDFSAQNTAAASAEAARLGLGGRIHFETGDAECLPLEDACVDAIICECAFCTFPDKASAAREFARVLKPSGQIGMSDMTRTPGPPGEFADLMAWIACLAGAQPAEAYGAWLVANGFADVIIERRDEALIELIRTVGQRLFAAEVLKGLDKIELPGIDFTAAKRLTQQALDATRDGRLGYAIICATKH
jgi:arsenite methyltransferase